MLQAYKEYKDWWVIYRSYDWAKDYYAGLYKTSSRDSESDFSIYWSSLSHYKMFEILLDWVENPEVPEGN